jgi:exopolyphosphatase/guanosine-5'-triphosphate,3'-diphosphate pyrophosphatase
MTRPALPRPFGPVGIIDIGSNSVRFVAFGGSARVPSTLFNEKIMAALGKGVARNGALEGKAVEETLVALARFRLLAREMGLKKLHTVATAAVRDASNGDDFLKRVTALGLKPRVLSGVEEAELSGLGVISAIPRANGIVADLGGGSLELVGVARGAAGEGVSLPLGVLRLGENPSPSALTEQFTGALGKGKLKDAARGNGLYLVGGSFRSLAALDLKLSNHPLPIVHQHRFTAQRIAELRAFLRDTSLEEVKQSSGVSRSRLPTLGPAAALLEVLITILDPRKVVVSAFGLREGLLYSDLSQAVREVDPLLAAALEVGEQLGRFGDHGAALDQWIAPLFPDETVAHTRLRLAACLLADIAWNAHPDFRAERAVDLAVHGNWVGIDAHGRALLGRALCSAFGGDGGFSKKLEGLLREGENERAAAWGKAIRLAQRLSGGTETLLRKSRVELSPKRVTLTIAPRFKALYAEAIERRLKQLAAAIGREAAIKFG